MPTCTAGSLSWPDLKDISDSSISARLQKYIQVNAGSSKHRGDTASSYVLSCSIFLKLMLPPTQRLSLAICSLLLTPSALLFLYTFTFTSQGHPNQMKDSSCSSLAGNLVMNGSSAFDNKWAGQADQS